KRIVWIELQRLAVIGQGLVAPAELLVNLAPCLDAVGVVGRQRHGLLGVGQAVRVFAFAVIGPGAVIIGTGIIGLEPDRLGVIGDRLVEQALADIVGAALEIR